ncbi:hypothetical protein BDW75DRAFT_76860 [Aspergillus navahoensis]
MTTPKVPALNPYYNLGSYTLPISTLNPDTQVWFTHGLIWIYAFNHGEAVFCFNQAIAHDPSCAMAYWGLAYAVGPNYNKPWERFDRRDRAKSAKTGYEAARRAARLAKTESEAAAGTGAGGVKTSTRLKPWEKAVIDAMQSRFENGRPPKVPNAVNRRYAEAMGRVYEDYGDDVDIAVLYADALMNVTPWALWDLFTGQPAKNAPTMLVKSVLERALLQEGADKHPGLLHLYIHYIEMSPTPDSEKGLQVADKLRDLVPDAGHIHHMPTHLDILVGDWKRSIESNYKATLADDRYLAKSETGAYNLYTFYRLHNYHSLIYAAMFAGQKKTAIDALVRMEKSVPSWEGVLSMESPPMADWLENFLATRVHVMVRFGMWRELIAMGLPEDQRLFCVTTTTTHYGKGLAYAATGEIEKAKRERTSFHKSKALVPASRRAYNSKALETLAVASAMLDGEIAYREQMYKDAWRYLRRSIKLDDRLPYSEPWAWMQPSRHAYAALLLEQGYVGDAAAEYRADLGLDTTLIRPRRHPRNVWALTGYKECLMRMGNLQEAREIEKVLREALKGADVPIRASCFCRLDTAERTLEAGVEAGAGAGCEAGGEAIPTDAKVRQRSREACRDRDRERESRL